MRGVCASDIGQGKFDLQLLSGAKDMDRLIQQMDTNHDGQIQYEPRKIATKCLSVCGGGIAVHDAPFFGTCCGLHAWDATCAFGLYGSTRWRMEEP